MIVSLRPLSMVLVPPSVVSTERRTPVVTERTSTKDPISFKRSNCLVIRQSRHHQSRHYSNQDQILFFTREKTNRKRPPDANLESSLSSSTDLDSKEHSSQENLTPCSLSTAGEIREAHPDNGK